MAPQVYLTMYKEQFASPGRAKREHLRPTSAHRRNNPQPRQDFLFPRSLQSSSSRPPPPSPPPSPPPPVDGGRPLFPPVRHFSFHSPLTTCPDRPTRMPPVSPSAGRALPSAGGLQTLQLAEPPSDSGFQLHVALKHPARQRAGAQLRTRPQTSDPQHHFPWTQYRSGCYSCFHVVKPYKAGHYIIHPEFVSEGLR